MTGKLIIRAGLASGVYIKEHKAVKAEDGTYSLGAEIVDENAYTVLPGVALPRDPFVKIEEKTATPAYLYVEIENTADAVYTVTGDWTELADTRGQHNGKVYYYKEALTNENMPESIAILSGTVTAGSGELNFYPYMVKAEEGKTASECFDPSFISSGTVGTYTPAVPGDPKVVRETDGTVDVDPNNEDHSVYVRATVVVNWKMGDGSIFAQQPVKDQDYTLNSDSGWFYCKADGFYYYKKLVKEGGEAPDLVAAFTQVEGRAPEDCTLSVTVAAQTIQAAGGAVTEEWGCTVNSDGTISKN